MSLNSFSFIFYFVFLMIFLLCFERMGQSLKENAAKRIQLTGILFFSYFFIFQSDWRF